VSEEAPQRSQVIKDTSSIPEFKKPQEDLLLKLNLKRNEHVENMSRAPIELNSSIEKVLP
jgi:hypothetical protein